MPRTARVDDDGLDLKIGYDDTEWGAMTSVKDPNGNTTTCTVEASGNVTSIVPPTSLGYETKHASNRAETTSPRSSASHGSKRSRPLLRW